MSRDLSLLEIRDMPDPWREGIARGWKVIDGTSLEDPLSLEADVVIIGSGAGGAVSAEILAKAGLEVIIIEAAALKSTHDFDLQESTAYRHLYQEGATRMTADGAISILQGRAVGGTTVVNWTSSFRTPERTLAHWRDHHGLDELAGDALTPWFEHMEEKLKVSVWGGEPNANNAVLQRGAEKLGWHWDRIPRNVEGCWDLGYCGTGCPVNAKQSMQVTALPQAMNQGATLLHSVEAWKLEWSGDRVNAVECRALGVDKRPSGVRVRVRVRGGTVIAAGGGIGTPGLLLRSRVPDPADRLGAGTTLHVVPGALGLYEQTIAGYYGAPQSIYSDEFLWRDGVTGSPGYKLEVMPVHPALAAVILDTTGRRHREEISQLPHLSITVAMLRDGFHPDVPGGRVRLRDDGSPELDYPITGTLLEGVRHAVLAQMEMHFAAGAKKVRARHTDACWHENWRAARQAAQDYTWAAHYVALGSAHVMGGCAMGADPGASVVDHRGRHHQLQNLHVFDGSVFPTSLGVNPQLSIYALSARNASLLARELRDRTVS